MTRFICSNKMSKNKKVFLQYIRFISDKTAKQEALRGFAGTAT
jgi:hypothetical protein